MHRSLRVAVVGGGIAGLASALFLARRGHHIRVYERDATAAPAQPPGPEHWWRRGTPQATHSHAFLAGCREILTTHAPDVLDALRAAGAREIRLADQLPPTLTHRPDTADDRLVVLAVRRCVLEWALRQAALADPRIELHTGVGVAGLCVEPMSWSPIRVTGVLLDSGREVPTDCVVDAAGRRSPVPGWLADVGAPVPAERSVPCGITYYSRFYELRGAPPAGQLNRGYTAGGSFDRYSCLVFPADNGTFSVTFGVLPEDAALRQLHHDAAFAAAAARVPGVCEWTDPTVSRPTARVSAMAGLSNRLRPLVADGRPCALGILQVGDSACITNPAHTRGTTLALHSAIRLAEVIDAHPRDPYARVVAMDAVLRTELEPWFDDSVAQDGLRLSRWRPDDGPEPSVHPGAVSNAQAYLAAQRDPAVWTTFTALQQLLHQPAEVLDDPTFVARVRSVLSAEWRPPALPAPSHAELAAVVASVAAIPAMAAPVAVGG